MATGAFGDGNLAALGAHPELRFESRLAESALLPPGAACTDTSDGLARALELLAGLNPGLQLRLELDLVPYADGVEAAAARAGIPREAFLLASAGEYELVALVPAPEVAGIEATGLWRRIGGFGRAADGGLHYVGGGSAGPVPHVRLPDPRSCPDFAVYCDEMVALARRLFGPRGTP
jgi:thiamine monophosphate kinase